MFDLVSAPPIRKKYAVSKLRRRARAVLVRAACAGLLALSGCGGGESANPLPPAPTSQPPAALVPGDGSALAISAVHATTAGPDPAADVERGYLLTRLALVLKPDATVDQLNAAARAVGATAIVRTSPGSPVVVLRVPRQAGVGALNLLARTAEQEPGVQFAFGGQVLKIAALPEWAPGAPVSPDELSHQLVTRFPQAWNARAAIGPDCLPKSTFVHVWDIFDGPAEQVRPQFFDQIDRGSFQLDPQLATVPAGATAQPIDLGHGYDVALTIAAKFDGVQPTGASPFPDCVQLQQHEAASQDGVTAVDNLTTAIRRLAVELGAETSPRFVLNISLGMADPQCGARLEEDCTDENIRDTPVDELRKWIKTNVTMALEFERGLRGAGLGERMLITQSVGNIDPDPTKAYLARSYLGFRSADTTSLPALATQLGDVEGLLRNSALWGNGGNTRLPDLTFPADEARAVAEHSRTLYGAPQATRANLLVVDSASAPLTEDFADIQPSPLNFMDADVRAIGEGVQFVHATARGSSFAAPQVAGLAAWLLSLSPELQSLPIAATADLIRRTARRNANNDVPIVDAYAATLRLDNLAQPGTLRIRKGLVDVNGDGNFDHLDLLRFHEAYGLGDPNRPTIPSLRSDRDYSRFDLNGDGYTGGIIFAAFDLDAAGPVATDGSVALETLERTVEGYGVAFNEAALSDLQILCFYAYSSLYAQEAGNRDEALSVRSELLGAEHCVGARIVVEAPARITAAAPVKFGVTVPARDGNRVPVPNVLVDVVPICASTTSLQGRTDATGEFTTIVTPNAGCQSLELRVTARADPAQPVLARQTVTIDVGGGTRSGWSTGVR